MSDVNQKIMERAAGNRILNPDEQRYYLGTFRERVLVTIPSEAIYNKAILSLFSKALDDLTKEISPVKVAISSQISSERQIALLTSTKQKGLAATIIDDKTSNSPYSVVIYTDHAINREETNLLSLFQRETETKQNKRQKGFLKHLFGH